MLFISSKSLFSFSQCSIFCNSFFVIFSFPNFSNAKVKLKNGIIMTPCLAEIRNHFELEHQSESNGRSLGKEYLCTYLEINRETGN